MVFKVVLSFFIFLLQAFCYGAEGIPEEGSPLVVTVPNAQRPLDRIITEDGVCPFFYRYCEKFYDAFKDKGVTKLPPRDDITALLAWSEQYFTKNQLKVSAEMCNAFVDGELMEALTTQSLPNMSDRESKVFVVPGDFAHNMIFMLKACSPSNFVFLTTKTRELCPEDFPPSEDVEKNEIYLNAMKEHWYTTTVTELMSVQELSIFARSFGHTKKTMLFYLDPEPEKCKMFDYFTQNMILLKSSLSAVTMGFDRAPDGILSMYPFALGKQKIADFILGEHINVYDIYPKVPYYEDRFDSCIFDSCLLLKGLASAFHAEFEVNILSGRVFAAFDQTKLRSLHNTRDRLSIKSALDITE